MNTELVIQAADESINIVVLKDGRLMELHQLPLNQNICSVFDIYLARVKRVASSLNAAFLDIGYDKSNRDKKRQFADKFYFIRHFFGPGISSQICCYLFFIKFFNTNFC